MPKPCFYDGLKGSFYCSPELLLYIGNYNLGYLEECVPLSKTGVYNNILNVVSKYCKVYCHFTYFYVHLFVNREKPHSFSHSHARARGCMCACVWGCVNICAWDS